VIIGRDDGHTFRDLLYVLRQNDQLHLNAQYLTLSDALTAGLGKTVKADFVVVLQSWSDEFAQPEINELIGRMLFGRILCCYGSWCTADGRSHELWPVAFRVPAASAATLIELELAGFRNETLPLFPMSAGEEVFAHRCRFPDAVGPAIRRMAVVVSDDSVLRKTVAGILATLNCETTGLPLTGDAICSHLKSCSINPDLAIVDLDGTKDDVQSGLDALRSEVRLTTVVGMSVFAASVGPVAKLSQVIEKTEMLLQLRRFIRTLPSASP
jgi:hypothetical protein